MTRQVPTRAEAGAVFAIAFVAAALNWWATGPNGLAMSYDSFAYAGSADWIRHARGWGYWLRPHLTTWPFGFPLVIAAVGAITRLDVLDAARVVQTAVCAGIGVAVWRLTLEVLANARLRICVVLVVELSSYIGGQSRVLLTGTLSTLLVIVLMIVLVRLVRQEDPARRLMAWAVALCSMSFLVRYQSGLLVGAFAASVWLTQRRRAISSARRIALFIGASSIVPVLYLVLNAIRSGAALEGHAGAEKSLVSQSGRLFREFFSGIGGWLVVRADGPGWALVPGGLLLVGLVVVAVRSSRRLTPGDFTWASLALLRFGLSLIACTVVLRFVVDFDLDGRGLSSCLVPIFVGATGLAEEHLMNRSRPRSRAVGGAAVGAWSMLVVLLGIRAAVLFHPAGAGQTSASLAGVRAELASAAVAAATVGCRPVATLPQLAWVAARSEFAEYVPGRHLAPPWCLVVTPESAMFDHPSTIASGAVLAYDGQFVRVYRG